MPQLRIRIAAAEWASEEYARIQAFYAENRDAGNAIRDPEVLLRALTDNKAYLIEEKGSKNLVGVSICFSVGDGEYTESGGTRIIFNGYRLQQVINLVAALHEFMRDPPQKEYYSVVSDSNTPSIRSLLAVGFQKWQPDASLIHLIGSEPKEGKSFYRLPRAALNPMRDRLLDMVGDGGVRGKKGQNLLPIEFDIGIIRDGRLTRSTEFPDG